MKNYDYNSLAELTDSLFPSVKFGVIPLVVSFSAIATTLEHWLGLDYLAIGALFVMMATELFSGLIASHFRNEKFSSKKLSRFGVKVAIYLVLIGVPYLFQISYEARANAIASGVFQWLHVFLVIHVVQEHLVSILENLASIQGKPKDHWISKIKNKITSSL